MQLQFSSYLRDEAGDGLLHHGAKAVAGSPMLHSCCKWGYGSFDIIFDHFPRSFKLPPYVHASRAVIYVVPMLIVC